MENWMAWFDAFTPYRRHRPLGPGWWDIHYFLVTTDSPSPMSGGDAIRAHIGGAGQAILVFNDGSLFKALTHYRVAPIHKAKFAQIQLRDEEEAPLILYQLKVTDMQVTDWTYRQSELEFRVEFKKLTIEVGYRALRLAEYPHRPR